VNSPPDEPKIENGRFAPIQPAGESTLDAVQKGPSLGPVQVIGAPPDDPSRAGLGGGGGIFGAGGTRRTERTLDGATSAGSNATAQAQGGGGGGERGNKDEELDDEDVDPDSSSGQDDSDQATDDNDPPADSSQDGPFNELAAVAKSTGWPLSTPDQSATGKGPDPLGAPAGYHAWSAAGLPRGQAWQNAVTWLDGRLVAFPPLLHRHQPHLHLPPKSNDCEDDPHVVPEPSSLVGWGLLLMTGGLLARRRRRKELP
jgi:hypothetical protein